MAIEEFHARSGTCAVTFYTNRQLSFSAALIKEKRLEAFEYAKIAVDPEYRRIYFSFEEKQAPGVVRFHKSGGQSGTMAIGALCNKYDWLDALRGKKEQQDRQFVLEDVDPNSEACQKFHYQYYITVGYTFSTDKNFTDKSDYPNQPGVYRLKKDDEVVRIGEATNIAARLKEHLKDFRGRVDSYDFEIVPNSTERKAEQKRLLDSFKASVGRLPTLNLITN